MSINLSVGKCAADARAKLAEHYPDGESKWLVRIIFEYLKGYSQTDMIIHADEPISDFIAGKVDETVARLLSDEPIQYIFGQAQFYGLKFSVTPDVLIPRQETEELVDIIVKSYIGHADLHILDLCTGSGCIAITLARTLRFPVVDAIDISPEAIAIARKNAETLKTDVNFTCADVLNIHKPIHTSYDIIVSNPPYITDSEKETMSRNVLDHEPHMALFVPDNNPLLFYTAISEYAAAALHSRGRLFLEINPLYAQTLRKQMLDSGWRNIALIADMQGRDRFLIAEEYNA